MKRDVAFTHDQSYDSSVIQLDPIVQVAVVLQSVNDGII
jgi:hypothetical protein